MLSGRVFLVSVLVSLCLLNTVQETEAQLGGFIAGLIIGKAISRGRRRGFRGRGRRRRFRFGRSAGDEDDDNDDDVLAASTDNMFLMASQADYDDCVKFYVCELGSRLESDLTAFESALMDNFADELADIDTTSGAVEFDLATVVGKTAGSDQCEKVYARCKMPFEDLEAVIRGAEMEAEKEMMVGQQPPKPTGEEEEQDYMQFMYPQ